MRFKVCGKILSVKIDTKKDIFVEIDRIGKH